MRPIGLPRNVACRNRELLSELAHMSIQEQNEALCGLWRSATNPDRRRRVEVTFRFIADLRHITVATKRTQWMIEAEGFIKPH